MRASRSRSAASLPRPSRAASSARRAASSPSAASSAARAAPKRLVERREALGGGAQALFEFGALAAERAEAAAYRGRFAHQLGDFVARVFAAPLGLAERRGGLVMALAQCAEGGLAAVVLAARARKARAGLGARRARGGGLGLEFFEPRRQLRRGRVGRA